MTKPSLSVPVSSPADVLQARQAARVAAGAAGLDESATGRIEAALVATAGAVAAAGGGRLDIAASAEGLSVTLRLGNGHASADGTGGDAALARLRHDLRTPLFAARGIVESLRADRAAGQEESVARDLDLIDQVIDEMLTLVDTRIDAAADSAT